MIQNLPTVHRTQPLGCPVCATALNACVSLTANDAPPPEPNDVTVCAGCSNVLLFEGGAGGLALRALEPEEIDVLDEQTKTELAIARSIVNSKRGGQA